jgi:hypothetical protein
VIRPLNKVRVLFEGIRARNRQQQQPFDAVAAAAGGRGRKEKCGKLGEEGVVRREEDKARGFDRLSDYFSR